MQAQQVQHGGVEVVRADAAFHGFIADIIGRTVDVTAFDTAAGHPHREATRTVVSANAGAAHLR